MVKLGELIEESITKRNISDDEVVAFIGMQDVSEDAKIISQHPIKFSDVKNGFTYFEHGDVLVAKITPCFENGKGAFLDKLETNIGFGSTEFHVLRAKQDADPRYIYQHTITKAFRSKLAMEMVGTAGHKRVPLSAVESYELPIKHNKDQQKAIADALSDADALIGSLETLIAKKRDIKTATMQQLLTGKKRLPGFGEGKGVKQTELGEIPEDWEVSVVGNISRVKGGKRLPKGKQLLQFPNKYPYIRVADMFPGGVDLRDIRYVPEEVAPQIKSYRIRKDDIFISVAGTLGIVGQIPEELDGANLTENADKITDISINKTYLTYWLMSEPIQSEIAQQATVGAQPKLALNKIQEFLLAVPPNDVEQKAIADVLSDVEGEIASVESELEKVKAIKQGMMQELLTGRTRLV